MPHVVWIPLDSGVHSGTIPGSLERTKYNSEPLCCSEMNPVINTNSLQPGSQIYSKERMETSSGDYRREVGGRVVSANQNQCHLYPFMNMEILGLDEDGAARTTAQVPGTQNTDLQYEVSGT